MCIVDVRRAFLHGEAERDIFIELPEQDPQAKGGKCVGKLKKTLYGTRDAPQAWQKIVRKFMSARGFILLEFTFILDVSCV